MSLLMQALKKAERARQSGLQEEDVPDGLHDGADVAADVPGSGSDSAPAASPLAPDDRAAPAAPAGGGLELSLEPLDERPAPPARVEPSLQPPAPARTPMEPAVEASHNPVPPQARHEGVRGRADTADIPVADARAAPGAGNAAADKPRGPGQPERRAMPRTAPARHDSTSGIDMGRLRVAGLAGILLIIVGTFAYLYWQAVAGPGPGASLPMVPMPPPSATGATSPAGDGGIVVAPAGPPFGPSDTPASDPALVAVQPDAAPPEASTAPPDLAQAAPPSRRSDTPARPTGAELAAIEDPEVRREAIRQAGERAAREARLQAEAEVSSVSAPVARDSTPSDTGPAVAARPMAATSGGATTEIQVARGATPAAIPPAVQAGYAAFGAGDLVTARQQYAEALRQDPNNRDALLGSAAVAVRERRDEEAAALYARLLAGNPRDADAIAGLSALRPGDGERAEVRLRGVLRTNPDAASAQFALGNLYARQGRWQEAQAAYFRAWSAAPDNADYAFNLAVGLDRLNQGRLARDYYQRALALAPGRAVGFDRAAVQQRLHELAPATGTAPAPAPAPAPAATAAPAAAGN